MITVIDSYLNLPRDGKSHVYLVVDGWDDWFKFRTMFSMYVFDDHGVRHSVGSVKLGQAGLKGASVGNVPGTRSPQLPSQFLSLDAGHFFSLGQNEDYYASLRSLPEHISKYILESLCDCAYDLKIFEKHKAEDVMQSSLLRSIREESVRNRLHRLAHGNVELTRFEFEYTLPAPPVEPGQMPLPPPPPIRFLVEPISYPPTNVHVLVGRNGAGKTRFIQTLVNSVLERPSEKAPPGVLTRLGINQNEWAFAGLVSVSFSAFDEFEPPPPVAGLKLRAAFVGLRAQKEVDGQVRDALKTKDELATDFVNSFEACKAEPRRARWLKAVRTLATDPLFEEVEVERLLQINDEGWKENTAHVFKRLSSGHAIVLLTTTRLVELVDENTLVVLDEPEGHLHPPLLSAFIRAVSDLLVSRNGIALISTHSPVVLQEVPQSCVWLLRRSKMLSILERPASETFGESAGILTREVFGLEVSKSGFHQMVAAVANEPGRTFEEVEARFSKQLGSEAKVLVRSLIAQRPN
jgi:predicted ATPase